MCCELMQITFCEDRLFGGREVSTVETLSRMRVPTTFLLSHFFCLTQLSTIAVVDSTLFLPLVTNLPAGSNERTVCITETSIRMSCLNRIQTVRTRISVLIFVSMFERFRFFENCHSLFLQLLQTAPSSVPYWFQRQTMCGSFSFCPYHGL